MKQEGLKFFTNIDLTVAAMLIFFTVFVVAIIAVFRKGSSEHYDEVSRMPLELEEANHES